jgi:tetratricopeptide (TPR) repeat protein
MRYIVTLICALTIAFALPAFAGEAVLETPAGTSASIASVNHKGVEAYKAGKLQDAYDLFRTAEKADFEIAECHYNIAVVDDALGHHDKATAQFGLAKQYGGNNPAITGSAILKKHIGG